MYRVYVLTFEGNVLASCDLDVADDKEAIKVAQKLNTEHAVEVWWGPRRIVRVEAQPGKKSPKPGEVADITSAILNSLK